MPKQQRSQANQAKETQPEKKEGSNNPNWRHKPKKEVTSSSTIEEFAESSWAAVEISTEKQDNFIFDFSKIADRSTTSMQTNLSSIRSLSKDEAHTETAYIATDSIGAILFDSGCSFHMTPWGDKFRNTRTVPTRIIQTANAEMFTLNIAGMLHIDLPINGTTKSITLHDTLLCPNTPNTLISLGKLDNAGYIMTIRNGSMIIDNSNGDTVGIIPKTNGLYQIPSREYAYANRTNRLVSLYEAHCICGHQNYAYIKHMFQKNQVHGLKLNPKEMDEPECHTCMLAKATRFPTAKIWSSP